MNDLSKFMYSGKMSQVCPLLMSLKKCNINKLKYNTIKAYVPISYHRDIVMNPCKVLKLAETNLKGTRCDIFQPHTGSVVLKP